MKDYQSISVPVQLGIRSVSRETLSRTNENEFSERNRRVDKMAELAILLRIMTGVTYVTQMDPASQMSAAVARSFSASANICFRFIGGPLFADECWTVDSALICVRTKEIICCGDEVARKSWEISLTLECLPI